MSTPGDPSSPSSSALLWDQTRRLPKEQLRRVEDVYNQYFPLEVREAYAS